MANKETQEKINSIQKELRELSKKADLPINALRSINNAVKELDLAHKEIDAD